MLSLPKFRFSSWLSGQALCPGRDAERGGASGLRTVRAARRVPARREQAGREGTPGTLGQAVH